MPLRCLLLLLALDARGASRTLLLSLDGMGYRLLSSDPAARELKTLHAIGGRGTFRPLRPAFPSKTSPGHAAMFTGTWSGENGIFSNTNPRTPRAEHRFDESSTGFRSTALAATPVWTRAAGRGIRSVAYQVTQAYPFTDRSAGLNLPQKPVVINGYQTRMLSPHAVTRQTGAWKAGAIELRVERRGRQAVRVSFGRRSVVVSATGGFSRLLPVEADGVQTGLYLRLFEMSEGGFLLYRTSAHEIAVSGFDGRRLMANTGAFIANTPTALYREGGLGKPVYAGGDGSAERRYLECFALVAQQMTRQMLWLDRQVKPELFVGYYPHVDDLEHTFLGLSRTGHPEVDETRRRAYALLDAELRQLLSRFDDIVVVSDHGMSPATHEIHMSALLKELGWSRQQARGNASCVFLNTSDWKDGVIPVTEAPAERDRLARALAGHPLITRVYRYEELSAYGLAGERRPDACFEVVPLHYPEDDDDASIATPFAFAQGEHGFDPNREDMKSILVTTFKDAKIGSLAEVLSLVKLR